MTRYITLGEYFWLAEQVTGVEAGVLTKASRTDLADSALHAPAASFSDQEFYPDLVDKAAVLVLPPGLEPPPARWKQASRLGFAGHVPRSQ